MSTCGQQVLGGYNTLCESFFVCFFRGKGVLVIIYVFSESKRLTFAASHQKTSDFGISPLEQNSGGKASEGVLLFPNLPDSEPEPC